MEKETKQNIRKNCDILVCSGIGIIILSIWNIIKEITFMVFAADQVFDDVLDHLSLRLPKTWEQNLFIYLMNALEVFFRMIIGFKSVSKGKNQKKIPNYLIVIAFILTINDVVYDALEIYDTIRYFSLSELFYCFLDLFFLYPLINLDISFIKLNKAYKSADLINEEKEA